MSSLTEIEAALPNLTDAELKQLAADGDQLYRERKGALIYQDSYGDLTDADLIVAADRAFQEYDQDEESRAHRQTRGGVAG
ncbi:MAG: hypothetical protein HY646_10465 [Acidobacteria bacterium]|nr:hypothetical protein [Acidobacteriota bacterium]